MLVTLRRRLSRFCRRQHTSAGLLLLLRLLLLRISVYSLPSTRVAAKRPMDSACIATRGVDDGCASSVDIAPAISLFREERLVRVYQHIYYSGTVSGNEV